MDYKQLIAGSLLAAVGTLFVPTGVRSQPVPAGVKNIVLVHGAFAELGQRK